MQRCVLVTLLLALVVADTSAAQSTEGGLRGYVKDEQGGVLPGVTVRAASIALIGQRTAVTDAEGFYRLVNLPPGEYTVTAELQGFVTFKREAILMRAGSTFAVDIIMKVGNLTETVTVTGESPMIDVSKPSNVLTVQGEFLRAVPIQARRNWSDFMEMTPGVHMRTSDEGSGRPVYYGLAAELFSHVIQFDGAIAAIYSDYQPRSISLSGEGVADVQIKAGGVDAASPMGTGMVINVMTPSGGNQLKGSASYSLTPLSWNGSNTSGPASGSATPTIQGVNMLDAGLGGPIVKDNVWFFGSYRYSNLKNGIARRAENVAALLAFKPGMSMFNNVATSHQPYVKVTGKLGSGHEVQVLYGYDVSNMTRDLEYEADKIVTSMFGGSLVSGKVTSAWSNRLTTTFQASWNNKGTSGNDGLDPSLKGPMVRMHQSAYLSSGRLVGSGTLVNMGNAQSITISPSQVPMIRGDMTYFKAGWIGSHELSTGFFAAPRYVYDTHVDYLNDGFILEERSQINPANMSGGTVPFHRVYVTPTSLESRAARDRDIGLYVQDSWKPSSRLTINAGVRVDFVRRHDNIFGVDRMKDTAIGPRFGASYLVTSDARNVLRFSVVRVHEQVGGRDGVTSFGGASRVGQTDLYDLNGDGVFETSFVTPPATATIVSSQFDPKLHQPWVDEFIVGFRKQVPWQLGFDVALMRRYYRDVYGQIDINGIYPTGPNQPFGGFGLVDPNRGIIYQQTNNTWNKTVYTSFDVTITKNMSHNFQLMGGIHRQWQHVDGTWNPSDPARFIQPDAFPNNKGIWATRGNGDQTSYNTSGTILYTGVSAWPPYSVRLSGSYNAPWKIVMAASVSFQAGEYQGPILTRLAAADPVFGPTTVKLANGTSQSNPLATVIRFANATRGDGQTTVPVVRTVNLKAGRTFTIDRIRLEAAINVFNMLNEGRFYQWDYQGADQMFSSYYQQKRNLQPARGAQATVVVKF